MLCDPLGEGSRCENEDEDPVSTRRLYQYHHRQTTIFCLRRTYSNHPGQDNIGSAVPVVVSLFCRRITVLLLLHRLNPEGSL